MLPRDNVHFPTHVQNIIKLQKNVGSVLYPSVILVTQLRQTGQTNQKTESKRVYPRRALFTIRSSTGPRWRLAQCAD